MSTEPSSTPHPPEAPPNEQERLDAVRRYDILDTPPDGQFDRITALAARILGTPISIVSIVDEDRIWFKSRHGLDGVSEVGRDLGLCASAILGDEPWVVENATVDTKALANPLVAGEFGLRFYAGAPLITSDGHRLGTLCVMDFEPRELTEAEASVLQDLAAIVVDELDFSLAARAQLKEANRGLEDELESARRLEGMAKLAAGVTHDFNNHLSVILSYASLDGEDLEEGSELRRDLEEIRRAAERAAALTAQLMAFGRRDATADGAVRINDVVLASEAILRSTLGEHVDFEIELGPDLAAVPLDASQLERVLSNLVFNAGDAMPHGGKLQLITDAYAVGARDSASALPPGSYVRLRVIDSGLGMASDVAARAFDPFFTTKPEGLGTGLGLPTIHGLVTQVGGTVKLDSREGEGTTVTVLLPVAEPAVERPADSAAPLDEADPEHEPKVVLVVEDERALRSVTRKLLERAGHRVEEAAGPAEALGLCADRKQPLDILLTDVVLPGMSGSELAEQAGRLRPELELIFMSGYGDDIRSLHDLHATAAFLQKPFGAEDLMRCVSCLGPRQSRNRSAPPPGGPPR